MYYMDQVTSHVIEEFIQNADYDKYGKYKKESNGYSNIICTTRTHIATFFSGIRVISEEDMLLVATLHLLVVSTIVKAGWNEYEKELGNLQFQDGAEFHKNMGHEISMAEVPSTIQFPCEVFEVQEKAKSVHNLRPGDVKSIGAMGDSITAGNGILAKTFLGSLIQYRGYSWSVGGQSDYEHNSKTLPNILKHYNKELTGYATGIGAQGSNAARCNVAAPGNTASNMPGQAKLLVERMKALEGSSFQEDWKVITLFVGGNDLCSYCDDPELYSTANYTKFMTEALDELAANVPKAFVNVVSMLDLSELVDLKGGFICDILHFKLCKCLLEEPTRSKILEIEQEYLRSLEQLIASGRYDKHDDFTVVIQPFLKNDDIPRLQGGKGDLSYFAHDCFHFNLKGHNSVATALWKSMFEPVGKKSTTSSYTAELYCPKKDETFATAKNSKKLVKVQEKTLKIQAVIKDGEIQDGRLNDVIQGGDHHVFAIMVLAVLSVAVVGYGTFFLFQYAVYKRGQRAATREIRQTLIRMPSTTTYQSI